MSTTTQQETSASIVNNLQEQVLSDIHRENSTHTSWEEIVVITSYSLPAVLVALLHDPASLTKGIYIHKKKQLIETNKHQQQAIETQSKSATAETTAKREDTENTQNFVKSFPKIWQLILSLIAFILPLLFFL